MLAPRRWAFAFSLWLTLATILSNALPVGSALARDSGSAFNPFTSDVSLGPKHNAPPAKDKQEKTSTSDGNPVLAIQAPIGVAALAPGLEGWNAMLPVRAPRGIFPGRLAARPFLARAPPLA